MEVKELFLCTVLFGGSLILVLLLRLLGLCRTSCFSGIAFAPQEEVFLKQAGTCVERGQLPSD